MFCCLLSPTVAECDFMMEMALCTAIQSFSENLTLYGILNSVLPVSCLCSLIRSPGCWWWTLRRGTQLRMRWTIHSSNSMWWQKSVTSVHTGSLRWDNMLWWDSAVDLSCCFHGWFRGCLVEGILSGHQALGANFVNVLAFQGHMHDCARHHANLLQLPSGQACDQGCDPERPLRCEAHPQAHRRLCLQDLWTLGEEGPDSEQSGPVREHSQNHLAVHLVRTRVLLLHRHMVTCHIRWLRTYSKVLVSQKWCVGVTGAWCLVLLFT